MTASVSEYSTNARGCTALELKLFEDSKDTIKLKNVVSGVVDDETQAKIDVVKQRLIKFFGYNETSRDGRVELRGEHLCPRGYEAARVILLYPQIGVGASFGHAKLEACVATRPYLFSAIPKRLCCVQCLGATEIGAVISSMGKREHAVITPSGTPHLRLQFDDAAAESDDPIEAARLRMRRRAAAEIGLRLEPSRREHAESILNFAREHSALRGALLCQCLAGVSRSSAAALLCLASWTEPGDERACVSIGCGPGKRAAAPRSDRLG